MKFKKLSIPEPSVGTDYFDVIDQVVPDQSMSLDEILTRFVRGESLPVGFDVQEGDENETRPELADVDLEKLANSDLVDKAEFVDKLKNLQYAYDKQEREKAEIIKAEKQKKFEELDKKRIRMEARKLAKSEKNKLA